MKRPEEFTSAEVATLAARGVRSPENLTMKEVRAVCASALTQARPRTLLDKVRAAILGVQP
jgi:hypothetical protein